MRFRNFEDNKNWTTDEKQMKASGLYKFVEGNNLKEKLHTLNKGKRDDCATFQE